MQRKIPKQKIAWKLIQVNLCSTFDSQHRNSWHFKTLKVIAITSNEKLSCRVQDIKPERTTGMQQSELLALG